MRRANGIRSREAGAGRLYSLAVMLALAVAEATAQQKSSAAAERAPQPRIVVSIPDRKLAVIDGGEVVRTYPVAVGAAVSPSPKGEFKVVNRLSNPTYYHPGVVIPPGKDNPLGTRWVGLNHKGYGIHGTNQPSSIGHAASHGCIRMARTDLEELFQIVRIGDSVEISNQPLQAMLGRGMTVTAASAGTSSAAGQL